MVTTGLLASVPISAESNTIFSGNSEIYTNTSNNQLIGKIISPLTSASCNSSTKAYSYNHYTFSTNDNRNQYNAQNRYGFEIFSLKWYNHKMIDFAYQTEIMVQDVVNGNWNDLMTYGADSCTAQIWVDGYGWHQNVEFYWNDPTLGKIYYIADFGIENGLVHFGNYFWWSNTGTHGVGAHNSWWKLEIAVGDTSTPNIVTNHGGTISKASAGTVSNWISEKYTEAGAGNSNHYLTTYYYGAGYESYHDWAAVNTPYITMGSLGLCADGSNLNSQPGGAEYLQTNLLDAGTHAYSWTEWSPSWS